jgi:hypothetical protein
MLNTLRAVRELRQAGKIQKSLVTRMTMFAVISVLLLGFVIYDTATGVASWMFALPLFVVGFVLGYWVFSRMQKVVWDDEKELVAATRMDAVGFAVLALYIAFEVSLRHELPVIFPAVASVTPLLLATIGGTLLGRFVGMMSEILRANEGQRR